MGLYKPDKPQIHASQARSENGHEGCSGLLDSVSGHGFSHVHANVCSDVDLRDVSGWPGQAWPMSSLPRRIASHIPYDWTGHDINDSIEL